MKVPEVGTGYLSRLDSVGGPEWLDGQWDITIGHQKASAHSTALLDLSAVLIYSITVTDCGKLCRFFI
ncbi:hypothetical protein EMCRGX_G023259 [Ephydatia muelleri]